VARLVCDALLLRSVEYGETDLVVHLLSPDAGRVHAIAKGARRSVKRFPGTLDLFNLLRVQIERRAGRAGMARLEQASLRCAFVGLRELPERYALASYLVELLDRMAPEGGTAAECQPLFDFARAALAALELGRPDARVRVLLELRALDALGLRPELSRCVQCGRRLGPAPRVRFHVADGGPLCEVCVRERSGTLPVHLGTLRSLEQGLRLDPGKLDRLSLPPRALAEAARLISRFQRFHLGVELRSERFLDEILPRPGSADA